jgi:hypothetical protein
MEDEANAFEIVFDDYTMHDDKCNGCENTAGYTTITYIELCFVNWLFWNDLNSMD